MSPTGTAVVLGAAGGIGAACAARLMASGRYSSLLTFDRLPRPGDGEHLLVDLAVEGERERAIGRLLADPGPLRALVYAAGIAEAVASGREAWPAWRRILEVDLLAAAHVLCAVHDRLVSDGCATVVIDSTAADVGSQSAPPYAAAKAGLRLLTRSLACRTGSSGARYNSVAPGPIDTALGAGLARSLGTSQQVFAERTVAKRLGTADEVAAAVDFLCGPGGSYVNGTVLVVDGGYLAG